MKKRSILFLAFSCVILSVNSFAQVEPKFDFYGRGPYRESIPKPQKTLRFDVGEQHTTYGQMEQVIFGIASAAPDRVKIFEIGTTNENRMQYVVAISSPENIARLDEIKANTAKLADPRNTVLPKRPRSQQIRQRRMDGLIPSTGTNRPRSKRSCR